ncbi:MAG: hypothetical protein ABIY70_00530 [Capsulimonas sp.]|uniref:hypothetical protein n=1 Tax=Capsulimonas sp. TaxID=2494211 RepID=UPI0032653E89
MSTDVCGDALDFYAAEAQFRFRRESGVSSNTLHQIAVSHDARAPLNAVYKYMWLSLLDVYLVLIQFIPGVCEETENADEFAAELNVAVLKIKMVISGLIATAEETYFHRSPRGIDFERPELRVAHFSPGDILQTPKRWRQERSDARLVLAHFLT